MHQRHLWLLPQPTQDQLDDDQTPLPDWELWQPCWDWDWDLRLNLPWQYTTWWAGGARVQQEGREAQRIDSTTQHTQYT